MSNMFIYSVTHFRLVFEFITVILASFQSYLWGISLHFRQRLFSLSTTPSRRFHRASPLLMKVHATILTAPTSDTPGTAIIVHFDDKRYIFGRIAEGSQRAFVERRVRLAKVQDIFLTGRTEWATTGGLLDENMVTLHGGRNLFQTIAATKSFLFRGQLKMNIEEIKETNSQNDVFKDNNVTVRTLHISPTNGGLKLDTRKRSADEMGIDGHQQSVEVVQHMFATQNKLNNSYELEDVDPHVTRESTEGKRNRTSSDEGRYPSTPASRQYKNKAKAQHPSCLRKALPSLVALSYIMTIHDHWGKFLPKVAKELGVEPGPKFGLLSNGHPVVTRSGGIVHPHEVMEPTIAGTGIAVCDLPEADYIAKFVSHPEWSDTQVVQKKIGCFFWILGFGIAHDPRLIKFMKRFPGSKHIIASADVSTDCFSFGGAAKFATRLNHLDPVFFPQLHSGSMALKPVAEHALRAEPGLVFHIKPEWALERQPLGEVFDATHKVSAVESGSDFLSIVNETRESLVQLPPKLEEFPGSDVEVCTLGTGSSVPSRYRNVSSTLVTIPDNCSILLDCGEGTIGQMKRVFGPDQYYNRLVDIRVLYISHLHADHHLGSISFLKEQQHLLDANRLKSQPTFVVAPNSFWTWLTDYSLLEDFGINRLVFVSNEHLRNSSTDNFKPTPGYNLLIQNIKLKNWVTAPALHCQSAFTTALTFQSGFKLAYSGDTRPTSAFVSIGNGATLLIHEATFDDHLIAEAVAKKHSTIGEAIRTGQDMCANKIALVHFSQRYPKTPNLRTDAAADIIYGFDYMRFKVGEINRFHRLIKALAEVYKGDEKM
ncbi:beta-lactamase-like protein [Trichophaea hybrida]|nr:beta-lactamase-like protein [Trichophaea hybrida]